MKKTVKTIGMTAALAVMIPLSAYAASTAAGSGNAGTPDTASAAAQSITKSETDKPFKEFRFGKGALEQDVLDLLKLDRATLKSKLAEGKTLAEIAAAQGVSRDALKKALTDSFNKKLEEQKQAFGAGLETMIDTKGNTYPDKESGFKDKMRLDLSAAAGTLGLTETEMKTALASGKSLADLAKEKNVDVQKLTDAIIASIKTEVDEAVKSGKLTQAQADKRLAGLTSFVDKIVNDSGLHEGRGGHSRHEGKRDD